MLEEEAKKRMSIASQSRKGVEKLPPLEDKSRSAVKAGKLFNVSEKYVREAKKLKETNPQLLEEVRLGHKNFSEIKKEQRVEKIQKQREALQKEEAEWQC